MATILTFDLPSKSACPPLLCGVNDYAVIQLRSGSIAKSHDGSGYLIAPITSVARSTGLNWRYTVSVPSTQLASGATLTSADVFSKLGCISLADAALFAKNVIANGSANWEITSIAVPTLSSSTTPQYLFRRNTSFAINAIEIGAENPPASIQVQLQVTTADGTTYSNIGSAAIITPPAKTARVVFGTPLTIPAKAAVRAMVSTFSGVYTSGATLDLHLFTSPK